MEPTDLTPCSQLSSIDLCIRLIVLVYTFHSYYSVIWKCALTPGKICGEQCSSGTVYYGSTSVFLCQKLRQQCSINLNPATSDTYLCSQDTDNFAEWPAKETPCIGSVVWDWLLFSYLRNPPQSVELDGASLCSQKNGPTDVFFFIKLCRLFTTNK